MALDTTGTIASQGKWTSLQYTDLDSGDWTEVIDTTGLTRIMIFCDQDSLLTQGNIDPTASGPGATFKAITNINGFNNAIGTDSPCWATIDIEYCPKYIRFQSQTNNSLVGIYFSRD